MFLLLCPSLSHASYYGIGCISVYLYEVFTTKVKQCLNWSFLRGTEQFDGKAVVILLWLILEQCLSTEDLSAK